MKNYLPPPKTVSNNLTKRSGQSVWQSSGVTELESSAGDHLSILLTLEHQPPEEQKKVVTETLPIFFKVICKAPFSERGSVLMHLDNLYPAFHKHFGSLFIEFVLGLSRNRKKLLISELCKHLHLRPLADDGIDASKDEFGK